MSATLAFLGPIGWQEMFILALIGLLLFGKRLPEVGRNLGKGIVEFKKGLQGIEDEVRQAGPPAKTPENPYQIPPPNAPAAAQGPAAEKTAAPTQTPPSVHH
ncbi:MAG: twin-arginine translocase TatA/TatE family subunit [Phycisphaeraceae bacterium]|nr:twin-arginine translocase TatA/TatE family subunit [Phycisphaeraceae bacterium]